MCYKPYRLAWRARGSVQSAPRHLCHPVREVWLICPYLLNSNFGRSLVATPTTLPPSISTCVGGSGPGLPLQSSPPSGPPAPSSMCQSACPPLCSCSNAGLCAHVFTATELNTNGPADVGVLDPAVLLPCRAQASVARRRRVEVVLTAVVDDSAAPGGMVAPGSMVATAVPSGGWCGQELQRAAAGTASRRKAVCSTTSVEGARFVVAGRATAGRGRMVPHAAAAARKQPQQRYSQPHHVCPLTKLT